MAQKFAAYRSDGSISAFYDEIDSPVPAGISNVIKITDAQWQKCLTTAGWSVRDGVLIAPTASTDAETLENEKVAQIAKMSVACQVAICSGFTSDALGAAHTYPTDDKSQLNLTASVTDSLLQNLPPGWTTPFMCADSSGVWAMRPHTAAQIQQAGSDGKAFVLKNLQQNATLAAEVAAAATVAAVQAIVWTNPA